MAIFYDPKDEQDLARIEDLLRQAGIEYSLRPEPEKSLGPAQICVAEEDMPRAEELLSERQQAPPLH